ncbi:MAG: hypothetical protein GY858_02135 [Candidatus Omnitrophica bacterium]|nr:hypothetical protein [Candidatus Omnitrophota bacterium]
MSKKIVIIFVEVIIVFLFLVAVNFFHSSKTANLAVQDYKFQLEKMGKLVSKSIGVAKDSRKSSANLVKIVKGMEVENESLKSESLKAKEQIIVLSQEISDLKINSDTMLPIKNKIKSIVIALDKVDIDSMRREELDALLRSIYEEVNSLDFSVTKLVKNEPLYRERIKQSEKRLQEKSRQLDAALRQNETLTARLSQVQESITALQEKVVSLEGEKQTLSSVQQAAGKEAAASKEQISALQAQRDDVSLQLASYEKETAQLQEKLGSLVEQEKELFENKKSLGEQLAQVLQNVKSKDAKIASTEKQIAALSRDYQEANTKYLETREIIVDYEKKLSKRANTIITLQDVLEEKEQSTIALTVKLKDQLRELAVLRNDMVQIRLENARFKEDLISKEAAFDSLRREIIRINEANSQFRESMINASRVFNENATPSTVVPTEKAVKVNIDSVEIENEE